MADTELVSLGDLVICACEKKDYNARDVIDAALFRGEIEPTWKALLHLVAAEEFANNQEMEVDSDALEAAVEAFRYGHDLITAEETEQWLAARGLNLNDFGAYFERHYWRDALEEKLEPADVDFISAPSELRELFAAELILSGEFDRLVTRLMWRLAALAAAPKPDGATEVDQAERQTFFKRHQIDESAVSGWLNQIGRDDQWFAQMIAMETSYRRDCEAVLEEKVRKREMSTLRLPLTRFEAEVIQIESLDAAKEAHFCIREDGMSMEEVATEGRYPYRTVAFLQEEVPAELQSKFFSVVAGDLLDPLAHGDGFELYRITKKAEPNLDDPTVRRKIDDRVLARHFAELVSKHVEPRLADVTTG